LSAAEPIVEQLALIKQRADPYSQNLVQFVVADLLDRGTFERHLAGLRDEHRRRRDAVARALERHAPPGLIQWKLPDGGLYFWCRLPARVNAATVMARARADSIAFVPGHPFYVDNAGDRELRLCFTSILPSRADDAAKRLVRSIMAVRRETTAAPPLAVIV
jgi:2-aminoadipate transaminase